MEVDACLVPLPLHGTLRHATHAGDLDKGESAEELEVDDFGERGVDRSELVERIADRRQLAIVHRGRRRRFSSVVISNWPPRFCARRFRA